MKKLLTFVATLALMTSACGASDADRSPAATGATTTEVQSTQTSSSTNTNRPMTVGDLLADATERDVKVEGVVFWDDSGTRLCEVLMESYPPQCGSPSVPIQNSYALDLVYDTAQGVWWTNFGVTVSGWFDGEELIVEPSTADSAEPLESEVQIAEAFVAFAEGTEGAAAGQIEFADEISLGLGDSVTRTVKAVELSDPEEWILDEAEYFGYAGPFSALDVARAPYEVVVGVHPRCVADPTPPPAGMDTFRQISIQPTDATSCLEWWAVDIYLNPNREVAGLILDLYGP